MKIVKLQVWLLSLILLVGASCNPNQSKDSSDAKNDDPVLLSNPANKASSVYLTGDFRGIPLVSWIEEDSAGKKHFLYARFNHSTNRFADPMEIPILQNASIHEEGMPKIVVKGDGTMLATFEASVPKEGSRWGVSDIFYVESPDLGATWSEPKSVDIDKGSDASLSFSGLTKLSDGEVAVSWLDSNPDGSGKPGRPVKFARTYPGEGFGKPVLIEKSACECCRVALTGVGDGQVAVAYRDLQPGNIRDISISTSLDGGKIFDKPDDFSQDEWEINGCPHNGPSLISYGEKIYSVWYSGGSQPGVHFAELDKNGKPLGRKDLNRNARYAQLTATRKGEIVAAYNESYKEGDSVYSRIVLNQISDKGILERKISSPDGHGYFPVIAPFLSDHVVVAWRDGDKIYYKLNKVSEINQQHEEAPELQDISPLKNMKEMPDMKMEHQVTLSEKKIDHVCGMLLAEGQKVFAVTYKGEKYYLCSDQCVKRFMDSPDRFVAMM